MEELKHHFSHPHPLKLIVYKQTLNNLSSPLCSACKHKPSGMLYSCIICHDYFLHKTCFERSWTPTPSRVLRNGHNGTEKAVDAIQQMIINNSKAIAQAIVSANESGDNTGFHLLIQLISATNNTGASGGGGSTSGGGGGGGGGSLPEKITHPFDKKHDLTLLSEPAYGEGHFRCDACRERGNGYSYHCRLCGIDLHVSCAVLPLSVTHGSHVHTLGLVFESPYKNNKFPCDICMRPGSSQWLYRCKSCGFNAHLRCAAPRDFPQHVGVSNQNMITNSNGSNTDLADLIGLMSESATGGGGDYVQTLLGDGNAIDFLAGLFG